jgi:Gluconate 2-dehydrogenase subunit 3
MNSSSSPAFTPQRRRTLQAVLGRILPGTYGPGAARTAVAVAFEGAMMHPSLRGLRPGIEMLLDQVEAQALQLNGMEFSECTPAQQDELLRALEQHPNPGVRFLFRSVIGFSLEGLLGDPIHGGNRDFLGWEAIGLRAADMRSGLCRGAQEGGRAWSTTQW